MAPQRTATHLTEVSGLTSHLIISFVSKLAKLSSKKSRTGKLIRIAGGTGGWISILRMLNEKIVLPSVSLFSFSVRDNLRARLRLRLTASFSHHTVFLRNFINKISNYHKTTGFPLVSKWLLYTIFTKEALKRFSTARVLEYPTLVLEVWGTTVPISKLKDESSKYSYGEKLGLVTI